MEDGKELREDFLAEMAIERDQNWMEEGCSMLEMLVALSRRCALETDEEPFEWFWILVDNLGLRPYVDEEFSDDYNVDVDIILDRMINRTYKADGRGGLFPLRHAEHDQTKIEIWYQLASYLNESNTS
jgi:hypothetical protein